MEPIQQFLKDHPTVSSWIHLGISTLVAIVIVLLLLKLEKKLARKWIMKYDGINARFAEKVARFLIIFIAAMWVILSNPLTQAFGNSLFQGTAVLAAIAGFAAKPILSDMLCGVMISTTKPFNLGDRIELDDGTAGIVKDITIRHVVLQGIDTLKIVIPNSEVNARRVTNLSYQTKTRSIHSPYSVAREGDSYSPVYFIAYQPNGLEMAVTVYYEPTSPTEKVKDDVNSRVKQALDDAGIEIPYNYMTVIMNADQAADLKRA